jgi:hypothetical protein
MIFFRVLYGGFNFEVHSDVSGSFRLNDLLWSQKIQPFSWSLIKSLLNLIEFGLTDDFEINALWKILSQ